MTWTGLAFKASLTEIALPKNAFWEGEYYLAHSSPDLRPNDNLHMKLELKSALQRPLVQICAPGGTQAESMHLLS